MFGYPAVRRRSSAGPVSPTTKVSHHSPLAQDAGPSSPRTPTHQVSLSRVDEDGSNQIASHDRESTGGSRAPLVARDYATDPKGRKTYPNGHASDEEERLDDKTAGSFVILSDRDTKSVSDQYEVPLISAPPPPRRQTTAPKMIPPESVHDNYVSSYFTSLNPAPTEPNSPVRPGPLLRASSAPGASVADSPSKKLLPSPIDVNTPNSMLPNSVKTPGISLIAPSATTPSTANITTSELENKPIFEVFNAELTDDGEAMVRIMKAHLDGVLGVQERVGRMHLSLEGMGLEDENDLQGVEVGADGHTEDALQKRQRGIEEIMKQLDALSDRLRKFHHLGTPKLSFPQTSHPPTTASPTTAASTSTTGRLRTQSIDRSILRPSEIPNPYADTKAKHNQTPPYNPIFSSDTKIHSSPVPISPTAQSPSQMNARSQFPANANSFGQRQQQQSSFSPGFGDYLPGLSRHQQGPENGHPGQGYGSTHRSSLSSSSRFRSPSVPIRDGSGLDSVQRHASPNETRSSSLGTARVGGSTLGSVAAVTAESNHNRSHIQAQGTGHDHASLSGIRSTSIISGAGSRRGSLAPVLDDPTTTNRSALDLSITTQDTQSAPRSFERMNGSRVDLRGLGRAHGYGSDGGLVAKRALGGIQSQTQRVNTHSPVEMIDRSRPW